MCKNWGNPFSCFGGFAPDSLKDRIIDCGSSTVITSNEGLRGGKIIPLLSNVNKAIKDLDIVKNVIVVNRTNKPIDYNEKEISYEDLISNQSEKCDIVEQNSEDPLFILYTSGSTGKPKVFFIHQLDTFYMLR